MNQKNEHAVKPETWFGLNKPEAKAADVDAVIFGIPYDGGVSYRGGAAQAPDLLRANTDHATPCTERLDYFDDFAVLDAGNFEGERDQVFAEVQDYVEGLVRDGVRFTMIGGDHSVTIPVERGVNAALDEPFGIIHIDAHIFPISFAHTPQLSVRSLRPAYMDASESSRGGAISTMSKPMMFSSANSLCISVMAMREDRPPN